jgi:pimeloyl-ACP methyl ester carboxylesterase
MESRVAPVRDGKFQAHYQQSGSGEPLLYLHGAGGLQGGPFLDDLAERFAVYAPWHPGFGETDGLEEIDDIIDLALYYHDFMDALGIESAHVVGHSMGGMLAAELAALCSHRVRRLVLADPIGFWRDEDPVLDIFSVMPDQLLPQVIHDPQSEIVREVFTMPEGQDAMIEAMFQRVQSFAAAGKFMWPIPDKGLKRRIHRIQSPTLIVWGEHDGLVPPSYAEDFRSRIKGSRVVILTESAHFPMFEEREKFVSLVTEHLTAKTSARV